MSDYLKYRLHKKRLTYSRAAWLTRFRQACCRDANEGNFLEEAESEALKSSFYDKVKGRQSLWKREFEADGEARVIDALHEIGDRAYGPAILLTQVGSIEWSASAVLRNAEALWEPAKHDFALVTRDMRSGLLAERNLWPGPGDRHDQPYFKITAWGDFVPKPAQS